MAEDDPDAAEILQAILANWGHDVELASDGRQAIDAIARRVPDLLLLDLAMPALNGRDVVRLLRARPSSADLHVIIVSAFNDPDLGADVLGYMQKPVDLEALREVIASLARGAVPAARAMLRALRVVCAHCGARAGAWCRTGARFAPQLHSVRTA